MQVHSGRLVLLAMLAENGLSPLLRKCLVSGESSPQAAAHGEANVRVMVIAGHGHRGSWLSRVMVIAGHGYRGSWAECCHLKQVR